MIINDSLYHVCLDLECDYLNAQECCGRLNFWNIPKLWSQLTLFIMLVLSGIVSRAAEPAGAALF